MDRVESNGCHVSCVGRLMSRLRQAVGRYVAIKTHLLVCVFAVVEANLGLSFDARLAPKLEVLKVRHCDLSVQYEGRKKVTREASDGAEARRDTAT